MSDNQADVRIGVEATGSFRPAAQTSPLHSTIRVRNYLSRQIVATMFPLVGGFLFYGWRALGATLSVVVVALATLAVLRGVGWRGRQMRPTHVLWLALLLSMTLPAHLFSATPVNGQAIWPILPAAGIALALLCWLLGGLGSQRVQPAVITFLLLFVFFHTALTPRYVLQINHLFLGDLLHADPAGPPIASRDSWLERSPSPSFDALRVEPVPDVLTPYTSAQQRPDRESLTLQMLIRDQLPPLEDVIVAGHSGPIGAACPVAVIIGGLFLLYNGLLDFRIPLLGTIAAALALLILPIPIIITDTTINWSWLAFRPQFLGWPTALTFVNYELLCSPLLLVLFFLSNTPGLRPLTRPGRAVFALALGVLSAVFQLYASASIGPYVALLVVSLISPTLDRILGPNTLV